MGRQLFCTYHFFTLILYVTELLIDSRIGKTTMILMPRNDILLLVTLFLSIIFTLARNGSLVLSYKLEVHYHTWLHSATLITFGNVLLLLQVPF